MTAPETIPAGRLTLRPLCGSDAAPIASHCADARIARMTARIPHPYPPGAAEAHVAAAIADPGPGGTWAMDGAVAGLPELCGLVAVAPPVRGEAEIGYWVAPALWRQGIASAAVAALVRANPAGAAALVCHVFRNNPASAGVPTAAGFAAVGDDEGFSVARGEPVPRRRYRRAMA